jgi:hypothetical protein
LPLGQESVIGAVRIHDRELLHPFPLRALLRDVGDAAVEEGAFAGEARIDGVGAFMRRSAPVPGVDDKTLAGELRLQRDVIEVAADCQLAVRFGSNEALHERDRAGRRPVGEGGRGDFGEGHGADAARSHRLEQPTARKVRRYDLGDLPAERLGRSSFGAGTLRRRHHRHRDHQVGRAFIRDVDAELGRGGLKGDEG